MDVGSQHTARARLGLSILPTKAWSTAHVGLLMTLGSIGPMLDVPACRDMQQEAAFKPQSLSAGSRRSIGFIR
jgi:hypothetical protein